MILPSLGLLRRELETDLTQSNSCLSEDLNSVAPQILPEGTASYYPIFSQEITEILLCSDPL